MLNDEICKLRDELNKSIEEGKDYSVIYDLSVKLDKLIAEYYVIRDGSVWHKTPIFADDKCKYGSFIVIYVELCDEFFLIYE